MVIVWIVYLLLYLPAFVVFLTAWLSGVLLAPSSLSRGPSWSPVCRAVAGPRAGYRHRFRQPRLPWRTVDALAAFASVRGPGATGLCAPSQPVAVDDVRVGATEDEVRDVLGPPGDVSDVAEELRRAGNTNERLAQHRIVVWVYNDVPIVGEATTVTFMNGRVYTVMRAEKE